LLIALVAQATNRTVGLALGYGVLLVAVIVFTVFRHRSADSQ
jgi:hypothetical protein